MLEVRRGVRPLTALRDIVARRGQRGGTTRGSSGITRFVTDDGESGAWISMQLDHGRSTAEWAIAIVAFDDEQLEVEGLGRGWHVADTVVDVARSLPSSASAIRVRMFGYLPPAGWLGLRRTYATVWLRRIRSPARIVVVDAIPRSTSIGSAIDLFWPADATTVAFERTCDRFRYRVLLVNGSDVDHAVAEELVSTIEPCPRPARDTSSIMEAFAWMT